MPKVSVVIPTYNRARFLCEAINSVLNQTFRDFEVIVVDDGSTDNTAELLSRYSDSIHYVRQDHRGRSHARNCGIQLARGEYIAFLDSDDIWLPDKLERQMTLFKEDPDFGLVHGAVEVIDEEGKIAPHLTAFFQKGFARQRAQGETYERLLLHHTMYTSTVMVPRKIFEDIGLYDPALDPREDLDLYLRIAWKYRVDSVAGRPLCRYRVQRKNVNPGSDLSLIYINLHMKHLRLLGMNPDRDPVRHRHARRNLYIALARDYYSAEKHNAARSYLFQALTLDPIHIVTEPAFIKLATRCLLPSFMVEWLRKLRNVVK